MKYRLNELRKIIIEAMLNAYDVLGIPRTASEDEIKIAYRKKAREMHPDVNKSPTATTDMVRVNAAKAILSDPTKRANLDRELGSTTSSNTRSSTHNANPWEDFFKSKHTQQHAARNPTAAEDQARRDAAKRERERNKSAAAADDKRRAAEKEAKAARSYARAEAEAREWAQAKKDYESPMYTERRFTFIGGNSSKFWSVKMEPAKNIEADAFDVSVNWGRIGTQGQHADYPFMSKAKAQEFINKKISEKLAKGYQEQMKRPEPPQKKYDTSYADGMGPRKPKSPGVGAYSGETAQKTSPVDPAFAKSRKVYGKKYGFDVHTGFDSNIFGKNNSKFKPGEKANVALDGDKLKVTRPSDGHTQEWEKK